MSYNESLNPNSNYPIMSQSEWDRSPMAEVEPPKRTFDIFISQTLSKNLKVETTNYVVETEKIDEGLGFQNIDTSDTNWEDVYSEEHYTPLELIKTFKEMLENNIPDSKVDKLKYDRYMHLINECSNWEEDDLAIMEE